MEKFYFPTNGEITIDNVNINQLNTYELRKNIGIVSQGSSLISGTILENLLYGLDEKYIDESNIREALRYANLEEFVEKQKDKLDTNIGESGDKLSGGKNKG